MLKGLQEENICPIVLRNVQEKTGRMVNYLLNGSEEEKRVEDLLEWDYKTTENDEKI